jgi:uncharacterized protein YggT (Ycf19 family)
VKAVVALAMYSARTADRIAGQFGTVGKARFATKGGAMLLDARSEIALFVTVFAGVYVIALIAYVLTSWVRLPYSLQPLQRFLYDVCEPYLRFWRRLLPFAVGPMDFTPIVAILAVGVLASIVDAIVNRL